MSSHPYKNLEFLPEWKAVDRALLDLAKNGDIKELTAHRYVVGYLVKVLLEMKLLAAKEPNGTGRRRESNGHTFKANDLRDDRAKLGLSAKDYGKLVGVTGLTVYHWEAGRAKPTRKRLKEIANIRTMGKAEATRRLSGK
jgi:DNA-binding transcriptional regulator YiaG